MLIIIRVARGREWSTRIAAAPTTIAFSGSVSHGTEETNVERRVGREQDGVQLYSVSAKVAEVEVDVEVCVS